MIKCVGARWQLFSDQQWFVSPRATSLPFYCKRRERAGADHNCTLFETYQSYLCSSLLAIWWQLFWNLQFSELVSNFRAAGLLLKTGGLQQFTIVIYLKYFKATVVNVNWCLVGTFLQSAVVCMAYQKKTKAFGFFLCNGGKGLEQLTMIVDLKVEILSSLYQSLAVFGGNYSFLGHYYWWILCSSLSRAKAILLLLL